VELRQFTGILQDFRGFREAPKGMFSTMTYIGDIKVSAGSVAATFGSLGVIGLSIKNLDFGDIPVTTVEDSENRTGATFSPTYMVIGLTYSRLITDATSVGATIKLINESIPRASSSGIAFDLGLQYSGLFEVAGLNLGVTVKNIGPEMKWMDPDCCGRQPQVRVIALNKNINPKLQDLNFPR